MTAAPPIVDAEGAVTDWWNALSISLTVDPHTVVKAVRAEQRSGPASLRISRVGGQPDAITGPDHPQMTAMAKGPTKQAAFDAARLFANALWGLADTTLVAGVRCFSVDIDSGPTEVQDPSGTSRYLVVFTPHLGAV